MHFPGRWSEVRMVLGLFLLAGTEGSSVLRAWQQEVRYWMNLSFFEDTRQLTGTMKFRYINHSPDTLRVLYFHLYPNAFSGQNSAYAREATRLGNTEYLLAPPRTRSRLDTLGFSWKNRPLAIQFLEPDIVEVILPYPLAPGDSIDLHAIFSFRLPVVFSRLGFEDYTLVAAYCYPRIAVYDERGWNLFPYLEIGEFYGEFGTYDVQITVPAHYLVMATGSLQTPEEWTFWKERAQFTREIFKQMDLLPSRRAQKEFLDSLDQILRSQTSTAMKTVHFVARNVHDFTWMASPRWLLQMDTVLLAEGKEVLVVTAFYPSGARAWRQARALEILRYSLKYLSTHVGMYPYPVLYGVEIPLRAGSGMEYPMFATVSEGSSADILDEILVHEVAHQWFMGILGFNERHYPWMDEGLTSFYEARILASLPDTLRETGRKSTERADEASAQERLKRRLQMSLRILKLQSLRGFYQSPGISAPEFFSEISYFASIYAGTPVYLGTMMFRAGEDQWDSLMQRFYRQYQFQHPDPSDMHQMWSGEMYDWFFQDVLDPSGDFPDYRIVWVAPDTLQLGNQRFREVWLECRSGYTCPPFTLTGWKKDSPVVEVSYPGWIWEATENGLIHVLFPAGDYSWITVNAEERVPLVLERTRQGDLFRVSRPFLRQMRGVRFSLLAGRETVRSTYLAWLPAVGWNLHDRFYPALVVHNQFQEPGNPEILAGIGYSFASRNPVFYVRTGYYFYRKYPPPVRATYRRPLLPSLHFVRVGVEGQGASYFHYLNIPLRHSYQRWSPTLMFFFLPRDRREPYRYRFSLTAHRILLKRVLWARFVGDSFFPAGFTVRGTWSFQARVELERNSLYNPWIFWASAETGTGYLKFTGGVQFSLTYDEYANAFHLRFFGGYLPLLDRLNPPPLDPRISLTGWNGARDYLFLHWYLARFPLQETWLLRQVYFEEGSFRVLAPFTRSGRWLWTLLFAMDLPGTLPFQLFLNFGMFYDDFVEAPTPLLHELGISLVLPFLHIHLPLVIHRELEDRLLTGEIPAPGESPSFLQRLGARITFSMPLNPAPLVIQWIRETP